MTTGTLKDALTYAAHNPTSDFAIQLAQQVKAGTYDEQAKSMGIDLTPVKQSNIGNPPPTAAAPADDGSGPLGLNDPNANKQFGALGKAATDKVGVPIVKGVIGAAKAVYNRVKTAISDTQAAGAADQGKPIVDRTLGAISFAAPKVIETVAGSVGDILSNVISQFIPQKVKDTYGDATNKAISDIRASLDEPQNADLKAKIMSVVNAKGPVADITKTAINDGLNILALGAGKAAETAAKPIVENAVNAGADAAAAAAKKVAGAVDTAATAVLPKAEQTATSVASYINSAGEKVYTKLTPDELAVLKDEVKNIPEAAPGVSQIHLDPLNSQTIGGGKEVTREQFIADHPQAAEVFAKTAPANPDTAKIQDIISPKLNAKETRIAIDEGRVARGKDSVIFGKQPDVVTQSEAVQRAASTIQRTIPDAAKLDDAKMYTALDKKTTEMAQSLAKDMQQVPVKPDTTGKVVTSWKDLKAEQSATPEFLDNKTGNTAFQKQFENYLKQLQWDITDSSGKFKSPTPKTMNDIWDVRKAYDDSIPANVKNATENSSPVLQGRKTMWLQNRSILNSAINDTASGLGDTSKNTFADMSDMYDAKQNILSKAKIDAEGKVGILPGNKAQLLKWGLGAGVTLIGGDILLRKVGL